MSDPQSRLSFGATSIASLVAAVRGVLSPDLSIDWEQVSTDTASRAEDLVRTHRDMAQDGPGEQWLRTCSIVLAAYQVLKRFVEGPKLLSIFLEAMATPFRQEIALYLEKRFGISEDLPRQAFLRISKNFQKRGEQGFGSAFRYTTDVRDAQRNFVNIERCFFNDFFRVNQAAEVTSLFCALDKVWAETLEQPRYGVRFERPTTLAKGDDACRFQFHKTGA